ncbi:aldehyde dehydrogenase family protein [Streptomyces sp. NPDC096354]|uniref:aldehyde dehydrogenase family protein n=1 Tax=Streptomyces sp. NPDC096354 TaxID=3366088 RepID=UPI00382C2E90
MTNAVTGSPEQPRALWVAGKPVQGLETVVVTQPFDGRVVGAVTNASSEQIEEAVQAAVSAQQELAALPAYRRAEALEHVQRRLAERREELAELITAEAGKPLKWSRIEVDRAVNVFRLAAEEARRFDPKVQRLDDSAAGDGRLALIRRVPRGPVLAVCPFNLPLTLVAHKVAPALAVGAPVVVKPAPATPLSALVLGDLLAETELPAGSWSVIAVPNDRMTALVADPRLPVVSFTGSGPVGRSILRAVPDKHVTLELGGNAAAVVLDDWNSPEDLDYAAERIATFAHYQGGQACIGVQRVLATDAVYERLLERVVARTRALRKGDPRDDAVDVGPVINDAAAARIEKWVADAARAGARVLTGGGRRDAVVEPTVLSGVPSGAKVWDEEVFGPVVSVRRVEDEDEAFAVVNDSRFGLQAGVFTHNLQTAFRAHVELEVGGVIIGDVPTYRTDSMPYGGTKESGIGREGVRWAMDDFTYERVMVLSGLTL